MAKIQQDIPTPTKAANSTPEESQANKKKKDKSHMA
jgi:hypothetical protein